jgi:Domain of unknown function (DUF1836).
MEDISALRERLRTQRPVPWGQLPDFSLYMDQVLSYMERQVLRFDEDEGLTAAMVNNYTKSGLVPRAEGKKYSREHLAYLTAICILKRVLSVRDMDLVLSAELADRKEVSNFYESFRESLDKDLNLITDIMEAYTSEEDTADAAVHFALLSYAAGLASNRYVSLLREKRDAAAAEAAGAAKKPREKRTKTKEEP